MTKEILKDMMISLLVPINILHIFILVEKLKDEQNIFIALGNRKQVIVNSITFEYLKENNFNPSSPSSPSSSINSVKMKVLEPSTEASLDENARSQLLYDRYRQLAAIDIRKSQGLVLYKQEIEKIEVQKPIYYKRINQMREVRSIAFTLLSECTDADLEAFRILG